MKTRFTLSAIAVLMLLGTGSLRAADLSKAKCPVSGKAVKEASFVEYKGKKVYFCCDNCPKAFKKDTEKFAAKADLQLIATGQVIDLSKATCPVSGKAVKEASFVEYKGKKVYFCCDNCPKAFKKNTEKFAAKADLQLIATGQATKEE